MKRFSGISLIKLIYLTGYNENNNKVVFNDDKKIVNKDILGNEFTFNKAKYKKKKDNSKLKKKNNNVDEIICDWDQDGDDIEICDFTGEISKGKLIATFKV